MSNPTHDPDRSVVRQDSQRHQQPNGDGPHRDSGDDFAGGGPAGDRDDGAEDCEEVLEACLEGLLATGPVSDANHLRPLLSPVDANLRRFVLLELIKLDMALHAETNHIPQLESYLDCFDDLLGRESIPVDLVLEEIQLRKELGHQPSCEEYQQRFPQFDSLIAHLLRDSEVTSARGQHRKPPQLQVGSTIDDFAIVQLLGEGAFAHVFLARQLSMQRLVALKVSMGTGDEPQALAQFDHPNIVRVYDQRALFEPAVHLLYMQFHPGGTLSEVVRALREADRTKVNGNMLLATIDQSLLRAAQVVPERSGARNWIESAEWPMVVAWLGVQLAHALEHAHQMGVLHRDVKPANVLLTAEGIPKLADFNVSFAGAAGRAGAAARLGGSVGYMAPEHLRALRALDVDAAPDVGKKADLYSLAILLWELWQGYRPFSTTSSPKSWSDAVNQQLDSRSCPLNEPERRGSASERVLEKALRVALQADVNERPGDALELAGRLKLALHPEAAGLLDPADGSRRSRIARRSTWLVAGIVILLPNVVSGLLNFQYNIREIEMTDQMRDTLAALATWVNPIVYPLGVGLMVFYTRGLVRAIASSRAGRRVTSEELDDALGLGHRAALIGGACWLGAGIVYTVILTAMYDQFTAVQATHFFISMLICGGVAMVYPMFGMALLVTFVYYPLLIRGSMRDDRFDEHHHWMIRRCETYLLIAILLPLLGAALLISSESTSRAFMLTTIAAGVIGLLASFFAYRLLSHTWSRFAEVLSTKTSMVPGESS